MLRPVSEHFAHIRRLLGEKKYKEAQPLIDDLLGKFPRHPDVLFLAGTCRIVQNEHGLGIALLERAMDLGCQQIECLLNLANAYRGENDLAQATLYYEMALARPNADANTYANASSLFINEGNPEKAVKLCDEALSRNPESTLAKFNCSLALLEMGRWEEGFRDYHRYSVEYSSRAVRNYSLPNRPCPEWDGSPGKVVATYGEQGIGDEILFASCIPDLMTVSKETVVECDVRLEPLFRRSFIGAHVYGTTDQDKTAWPWHHSLDASIPMGGLPQFFRKSDGDFTGEPYLKADTWQVEMWRERLRGLGPEPKVLISWIGGLKKTRVEQRSIPLEDWSSILRLPCKFISIQWHEDSEEEAKQHGVTIYDEATNCVDFTASLMKAADLVITVNNTNCHLAGALGVPTWCVTPHNASWRFAPGGEGHVWYGSVRSFRQKEPGDWGEVMNRVAGELSKWLEMREAA